MPVFTFEKISPPIRRVPATVPAPEKPRSVIVQIIDRLVEARARRPDRAEKTAQSHPRKPAK